MLPCEATGVPRPNITWYKNGVSVKEGPGKEEDVLTALFHQLIHCLQLEKAAIIHTSTFDLICYI